MEFFDTLWISLFDFDKIDISMDRDIRSRRAKEFLDSGLRSLINSGFLLQRLNRYYDAEWSAVQ